MSSKGGFQRVISMFLDKELKHDDRENPLVVLGQTYQTAQASNRNDRKANSDADINSNSSQKDSLIIVDPETQTTKEQTKSPSSDTIDQKQSYSDTIPQKLTLDQKKLSSAELALDEPTAQTPNININDFKQKLQLNINSLFNIRQDDNGLAVNDHKQQQQQKQQVLVNWPSEFLDDVKTRIWLTYRVGFPSIPKDKNSPSAVMGAIMRGNFADINSDGFSTDCGWGCMIRTSQSLLANCLLNLHVGRQWRFNGAKEGNGSIGRSVSDLGEKILSSNTAVQTENLELVHDRIVSWFVDDPISPFSIHNFVKKGFVLCGKSSGEWFGPSAASRSIQALCEEFTEANLNVYIGDDSGEIYENDFLKILKLSNDDNCDQVDQEFSQEREVRSASDEGQDTDQKTVVEQDQVRDLDDLEVNEEEKEEEKENEEINSEKHLEQIPCDVQEKVDKKSQEKSNKTEQHDPQQEEYLNHTSKQEQTPVLILLGIRLGVDNVNKIYYPGLKSVLSLKQSVGIAGGRPSASHYFFGYQGDYLFFLDPHISHRPALKLSADYDLSNSVVTDLSNENPINQTELEFRKENSLHSATLLTNSDINSVHTTAFNKLHLSQMDPSMLIGFLIRNEADWEDFKQSVSASGLSKIVHIVSGTRNNTFSSQARRNSLDFLAEGPLVLVESDSGVGDEFVDLGAEFEAFSSTDITAPSTGYTKPEEPKDTQHKNTREKPGENEVDKDGFYHASIDDSSEENFNEGKHASSEEPELVALISNTDHSINQTWENVTKSECKNENNSEINNSYEDLNGVYSVNAKGESKSAA